MFTRMMLVTLPIAGLICCITDSVDLTGEWRGTASLVVDGEHKEVPLRPKFPLKDGLETG